MQNRPEQLGADRVDIDTLGLVYYPDPRLRQACQPIDRVDEHIRRLIGKMVEIMFAAKGVGLAGPQVGVPARLFIASPTFEREDIGIYVNPEIISADGTQQDEEEGCLSFPGVAAQIRRAGVVTIRATGLDGEMFEQTGEGLLARILQHESDHLDGRLIVDRMNSIGKLANRAALKDLEDQFG